MTRTSLSWSS